MMDASIPPLIFERRKLVFILNFDGENKYGWTGKMVSAN